jgi:cell division protein FtsL
VSVVSLPRRNVVVPRSTPSSTRTRVRPSAPTTKPVTREETRGRHVRTQGRLASISVLKKSVTIVVAAVMLSLFGSMLETNRQVQLHSLQSQVLQDQSTYAAQVGSLTDLSAPSVVVSQANALHLVNPTSVTQVPATSLDAILPLPKFSGYAPVTSRTQR